MHATSLVALLLSLPLSSLAAETVVGAYIFHRHGDRTPKSYPPANLTDLGYVEVYQSGQYYHDRYLNSSSDLKIAGINEGIVKNSQISVSSPSDTVLQNSALGFLQGLYPPVGGSASAQTLANGSTVEAPLDGYQLIPISIVSAGAGSENAGWLQDTTSCLKATASSNNYYLSEQYASLLNSTKGFYQNLDPVVNGTFNSSQVSYKNAYTIWDLINVATIHNSSIPDSAVLTDDVLFQTRTLADGHEWGLAYNASDNIRAIAGMQLAGEIVTYLNTTVTSNGASKLGVQFGSYGTFFSFFGLADLPAANPDFMGIPDYASSMVFELFTTATVASGSFPSAADLQVRFLYHNGTASAASPPVAYPLFGGSATSISWNDFVTGMNKFAVSNTEQFCTMCGETTGTCAAYAPTSTGGSSSPSAQSSSGHGDHISTAVGGVIGAMVTLGVVLGALTLFMLLGGYRLVSKKRMASHANGASDGDKVASKV